LHADSKTRKRQQQQPFELANLAAQACVLEAEERISNPNRRCESIIVFNSLLCSCYAYQDMP
jgi:hypothetical protein